MNKGKFRNAPVKRALVVSAALLVAAPLPAFAWSVPVAGGEPLPAGPPMVAGSLGSESAASIPLLGVGDRIGSDIQQFSPVGAPPVPPMGPEMMHWMQMMTLVVAPVAAAASAMQKSGAGSTFINPVFGANPNDGNKGGAHTPPPVPEPRSLWLFALSGGLLLIAVARRRWRLKTSRAE